VGFDWQPQTGIIHAGNKGPDHLGFEQPPEYFSRLDAGCFHGMPWFQYDGEQLRRHNCIKRPPPRPLAEVTPPVASFPARSGPMAVAFVPEDALDRRFGGDAKVALRGSWATRPSGAAYGDRATRRQPRLVRIRFVNGTVQRVEDLVTGFQLSNGKRWARPVGVAFGPDGALNFSSDGGSHALFRLRPVEELSAN
jgi:glucose/arabinose dehydrogenase